MAGQEAESSVASVTEAPLAAAGTVNQVAEKVRAYIESCQGLAADGVSISDFAQMVLGLLRVAVAAVDAFPLAGPAKKTWVLEAVAQLYDALAVAVASQLPWPLWILSRRTTRAIVLAAASGAVEFLLPMVVAPKTVTLATTTATTTEK